MKTEKFYEHMEPGYYHTVFTSGPSVQRYWHRGRLDKILGKIHPDNKKILDIGCGPGTLLSLIKETYSLCVGVDFDQKQIEFAKKTFKGKKRIRWITGDVTRLKMNRTFDYIICSEVIEHIEPDKADVLLETINKLLKKGGVLLLTTPNYNSLWPAIERLVNALGKVDYSEQHINKMTINTLKNAIAKQGFKIRKIETIYIISPFLATFSWRISKFVQGMEEKIFPKFGSVIVVDAQKSSDII